MTNITHNFDKIGCLLRAVVCCAAACIASMGSAQSGPFAPANGIETTLQRVEGIEFMVPTGAWVRDKGVSKRPIQGTLDWRSYRIETTSQTPEQMITPVRTAMKEAGFDVTLDCAAAICGGFDFRKDIPVIDPPAMFMDLRKFVALSGFHPDGAAAFIVASRVGPIGYMQVYYVAAHAHSDGKIAPVYSTLIAPIAPGDRQQTVSRDDVITALKRQGSVILGDLEFESGSANLDPGPFLSLTKLADYLNTTPDARIVLVGHTDAVGSLAGNMDLSAKRARAVSTYLTQNLGVAATQLDAQGIGYLSPVATNETPFGREENRRVVAVLIVPFK